MRPCWRIDPGRSGDPCDPAASDVTPARPRSDRLAVGRRVPRQRLGVASCCLLPARTRSTGCAAPSAIRLSTRWRPHITLVPPVNVASRRPARRAAPCCAAAGRHGSGASTCRSGRWPPSPGHEHVAYLEVGGDEPMAAALRTAAPARRWSPPLDRPIDHDFVPHVTLTQGVDEATAGRGAGRRRRVGSPEPVRFERLHLLEERTSPKGGGGRRSPTSTSARAHIVGRGGLELELTPGELVDPEARLPCRRTGRRRARPAAALEVPAGAPARWCGGPSRGRGGRPRAGLDAGRPSRRGLDLAGRSAAAGRGPRRAPAGAVELDGRSPDAAPSREPRGRTRAGQSSYCTAARSARMGRICSAMMLLVLGSSV